MHESYFIFHVTQLLFELIFAFGVGIMYAVLFTIFYATMQDSFDQATVFKIRDIVDMLSRNTI